MSNGALMPLQKIPFSEKNKIWRVQNVDFIIDDSTFYVNSDLKRMTDSYALIGSELDQDYYREICNNLGVNYEVGKKYVQAYNKCHNTFQALKGEERGRPFSFNVGNISTTFIQNAKMEEEVEYKTYMMNVLKEESEKIYAGIKLEVGSRMQGIPQDQKQQALEQITNDIEIEYKDLTDLTKIEKRIESKFRAKEQALNTLMKIAYNKLDLKWLKNETFSDAVIAGKEFVEIKFSRKGTLPIIRQLNPLNTFYHSSPDSPFIHDSDYAGYKERMTIGQVLDLYGDRLHKKDIEKLRIYGWGNGQPYGTDTSLSNKQGVSRGHDPNDWVRRRNRYPTDSDAATVEVDGVVKGIPQSSYSASSSNVHGKGLYYDDMNVNNNYVTVYTVYWKSYRNLIKYVFTNEKGELDTEIVSDDFVIPEGATKEKYEESLFSPSKYRYVWYDENGRYFSAEEISIPEVWTGTRISGGIYVDIEPLENAYQSLLNPYEVKLPIYGYLYGTRNSGITSVVDRLAPWQKLYYIIMSKLLRIISQDKGVLTFLNMLMIDQNVGFKKTLQMAEELGLIPFNPLAHSKGTTFQNTLKVAERVDATNANVINHYISLLQFIEANLESAVGVSPQRLAQEPERRETATDNRRQTLHSMNITESLFASHDLLWNHIMQGYMEMLISSVNDSDSKIRGFLSDTELAVIDLSLISLEDEYLLKVADGGKSFKVLEQAEQLAHALIQNDKVKFSTLVQLMETDDIKEFKKYLIQIEKNIEEREDQMQRRDQQHQEKLKQMEIDNREDIQKSRLDEIYLKEGIGMERDELKGKYNIMSYNLQQDTNGNGIPDLMEQQQKLFDMIEKIRQKDKELTLREEELLQRRTEHDEQLAEKQQDRDSKERQAYAKNETDLKKEREKAKNKPKPASR